MAEQILVVGAGFRGILASYLFAKAGHRVTLTDRAPVVGGVMRSQEWNGFHLDKGCHLFSNDSDAQTDLMLDLLHGDVIPVEFRYASVTGGRLSADYAIPDLADLGPQVRDRVLYELVAAAAAETDGAETLAELLAGRFGPTAAALLAPIAHKIYRLPAEAMDANAYWSTPFRRLALLPDDIAALLKSLPALDERLAVSSIDDPLRFTRGHADKHDFRNFYPAERGMRGFCDHAERRLGELDVELMLGVNLASVETGANELTVTIGDGGPARQFDKLVWCGDMGHLGKLLFGTDPLADLTHGVPMVLYYFVVAEADLGPYTYVQDYTPEHLLFRVSNAGRYSRQIKADGSTYVCAEVPTERDGPVWSKPEAFAEQVWRECVGASAVTGARWRDLTVVKAPVSYRVGLPGHATATASLAARLASFSDRIDCGGQELFFRNEIIAQATAKAAA